MNITMENENQLACQIMELSEHAIFVHSIDDYRVLYANEKAKAIFGEQLTTTSCHMGVKGAIHVCEDCPYGKWENGLERSFTEYIDSYGMDMCVKSVCVLWGTRKAVIKKVMNTESVLQMKQAKTDAMQQSYEEQLRLSGELYRTVVNQLGTIVFEYNCEKNEYYTSPLFEEKFGVKDIHSIDFTLSDQTAGLVYEADLPIYQMLFGKRTDDFREITCRLIEKNGKKSWYRVCIQYIRNDLGELNRVIGTLKDVDDVTRTHEAIKYRSEYDLLTGIPNVNRFYIDAASQIMDGDALNYAIISLDIDKFKMINDLFGMQTGDEVLKHVASIMRTGLQNVLYCRAHSDVFFFVMPYKRRGDIIKCIEKLRKGIFKNGFSFDINTSFGVYLVEDVSIPINLMCDRATLARRTVKSSAMKFCAFYDEQYREEILRNNEIEQDMNQAIADRQFVMYLQPKYDLISGKICGAEVLARWNHPVKGLIQPNDFVPLFERNGFILRLDEYMWAEACATLAQWKKDGKEIIPLSVNISRYHIKNNDLVAVWKRLIKKYGIDPSEITLEITETFFYDSDELYTVLQKLKDMGFRLEVDDFGAGYSSLNMIRHVPVNTIKIDKDFLDQKLSTEKGKIVISHTIAMAKDLKLSVVAEGVETEEHVEFLKSAECDVAQGYFFAKPMPLSEFNLAYHDL